MGTYSEDSIPLNVASPGAAATLPAWKTVDDGGKTTVRKATVVAQATQASGTAGYSVQLVKTDASGNINGTITTAVGTANAGGTFPGWTAGTPVDLPISNGALDSGEFVAVKFAPSAAPVPDPKNLAVNLAVVRGPATV